MQDEDTLVPVAAFSLSMPAKACVSDEDLLQQCPQRVREYYALALKYGLGGALGRAIYAHSRKMNTDVRDPIDIMTSCRWCTADKWRQHVAHGGSFHALKYTVEQAKRVQQERRDRQLGEGARFRRQVRRVRREAARAAQGR